MYNIVGLWSEGKIYLYPVSDVELIIGYTYICVFKRLNWGRDGRARMYKKEREKSSSNVQGEMTKL